MAICLRLLRCHERESIGLRDAQAPLARALFRSRHSLRAGRHRHGQRPCSGFFRRSYFRRSVSASAQAQVTLKNEATGLDTEITTNSVGLFVSPPLRPGSYLIEVRVRGFETAAKRVQLDVSIRREVDFELAIGAVSATVAVKEAASLLQTETSTLSGFAAEQPELRSTDHLRYQRDACAVTKHRQSRHDETRCDRGCDQRHASRRE